MTMFYWTLQYTKACVMHTQYIKMQLFEYHILNNFVSVLNISQLLEGHSIIYVSSLRKSKEFSVKLYRLLLTN
jgi:hypothetical protein